MVAPPTRPANQNVDTVEPGPRAIGQARADIQQIP
jgi:hypothetical protein